MFSRYLLPLISLAGFLFALYTVAAGNEPVPVAEPVAMPAQAPFETFIAGAGLVEAKSENIAVGTPLSGVVKRLLVKVGDRVKLGQVLFELDDREFLAEERVRRAAVAKARAGVVQAEASVRDVATLLRLAESVDDRRAISVEELERRRNALAIAKAALEGARAQVEQAEAELNTTLTTLERLKIRAPVPGEALQVNVHVGEFAAAGVLAAPLILLGNLEELHIRVDIDENDAWRFRRDANAVAFLRGNAAFRTDLTLAWVEPYIVPKRSLTGDSTERVDTRVLQVLYSFDPAKLPVYVGQQMDVFIEAPDLNHAGILTGRPADRAP
ncbi:MAG: biotin/lipoyl-binding protein [Methylotetracoccus sp.]|nr:biotin/lipoyl-binding protein [Methylotetracoccus sp.]